MNRRSVLALVGGGTALTAGCLSQDVLGSNATCPDPDIEIDLTGAVREPARMRPMENEVILITASDEIDQLRDDLYSDDDEQWLRETEFDESVVIVTQVTVGGGRVSGLEILGSEQESEDTIRVYSCIEEVTGSDVAKRYSRLLRVSYDGRKPDNCKYTNWVEGDKFTYESGE